MGTHAHPSSPCTVGQHFPCRAPKPRNETFRRGTKISAAPDGWANTFTHRPAVTYIIIYPIPSGRVGKYRLLAHERTPKANSGATDTPRYSTYMHEIISPNDSSSPKTEVGKYRNPLGKAIFTHPENHTYPRPKCVQKDTCPGTHPDRKPIQKQHFSFKK